MAQPSKLDQTEKIGARFNNTADSALEKRLQSHQLTPDERQKVTDLRKDCEAKQLQESVNFAKPEVKNELRQKKYAEIANRNAHPTPENFPPGMRNRTMSPGQMMMVANHGIQEDHQNKLRGFDSEFRSGVNGILKNAQENGRGPQQPPQSRDQNRDQNRGQNLSTAQDFNRAGNSSKQGQQQDHRQDFNRAADRDR